MFLWILKYIIHILEHFARRDIWTERVSVPADRIFFFFSRIMRCNIYTVKHYLNLSLDRWNCITSYLAFPVQIDCCSLCGNISNIMLKLLKQHYNNHAWCTVHTFLLFGLCSFSHASTLVWLTSNNIINGNFVPTVKYTGSCILLNLCHFWTKPKFSKIQSSSQLWY